MSKEAMKLALEYVEYVPDDRYAVEHIDRDKLVTALREALAEQPAQQQEPVAWLTQARCFVDVREYTESEAQRYGWSPLYTSPQPAQRTWVGLTDEMVTAAARALNKLQADACGVDKDDHWKFYGDDIKEDARAALEAAHNIKQKNTP